MSAASDIAGPDVLGIDVGGTLVKAARVAADGSVLATQSVATPGDRVALNAAILDLVGGLRTPQTRAVGVVTPGLQADGVVTYTANLPWRDEPVRDWLADALDLPVVLGRDVAAAALAESAQHPDALVLFVSLGTGIACAHVDGGMLRPGEHSMAGELGHCPVHPDGELCACGQRGCLEVYASAAGISRRYSARAGVSLTSAEVATRIAHDADAAAVWSDAVEALALALATDTLVNDPGVIVLGGGLAQAGDALLEPVRAALAARLIWRPAPPIRAAALGAAAGQLGAARLAWQRLPESSSTVEVASHTGARS